MKLLFVKKLYLWPRFRAEVVRALDDPNRQADIVELTIKLTPYMKAIQSSILVAMSTCMNELKSAVPHLDTTHMTLENGLFHAFDLSIRRLGGNHNNNRVHCCYCFEEVLNT